MEETIVALRDAIILQAAEDFRMALKALRRNPGNGAARAVAGEVLDFYRSAWFEGLMPDTNPKQFIREQVREVYEQ